MADDVTSDRIKQAHQLLEILLKEIEKVVVGQRALIERLLIGFITGGHILVEGVPGIAKTTAVKAFAQTISAQFQRIQFTPDLLPADLIGTQIYNPQTQSFSTKKGPLFHHVILADEINRAPAKVQSALLEAMQERQVTIGDQTFPLDDPFIVMATQNPIEQEGTYPLPEAQLDRFLLKVKVTYPTVDEELVIMEKGLRHEQTQIRPVMNLQQLQAIRRLVESVKVDPKIFKYIVTLISATREPEKFLKDKGKPIQFGASPRGSIGLVQSSAAYAFLQGRTYVIPQDVKVMAYDVLRHRIILNYAAEADGQTTDDVIRMLLNAIEVP